MNTARSCGQNIHRLGNRSKRNWEDDRQRFFCCKPIFCTFKDATCFIWSLLLFPCLSVFFSFSFSVSLCLEKLSPTRSVFFSLRVYVVYPLFRSSFSCSMTFCLWFRPKNKLIWLKRVQKGTMWFRLFGRSDRNTAKVADPHPFEERTFVAPTESHLSFTFPQLDHSWMIKWQFFVYCIERVKKATKHEERPGVQMSWGTW